MHCNDYNFNFTILCPIFIYLCKSISVLLTKCVEKIKGQAPKQGGLAPLVTYPLRADSTTRQNPPICDPFILNCLKLRLNICTNFYHGLDVSRAMVMWPPCCKVTHAHFIEQTRTIMFQTGQRPGTTVGDEWHILKALWSRKDI